MKQEIEEKEYISVSHWGLFEVESPTTKDQLDAFANICRKEARQRYKLYRQNDENTQ